MERPTSDEFLKLYPRLSALVTVRDRTKRATASALSRKG
jgi:hypothetical protein